MKDYIAFLSGSYGEHTYRHVGSPELWCDDRNCLKTLRLEQIVAFSVREWTSGSRLVWIVPGMLIGGMAAGLAAFMLKDGSSQATFDWAHLADGAPPYFLPLLLGGMLIGGLLADIFLGEDTVFKLLLTFRDGSAATAQVDARMLRRIQEVVAPSPSPARGTARPEADPTEQRPQARETGEQRFQAGETEEQQEAGGRPEEPEQQEEPERQEACAARTAAECRALRANARQRTRETFPAPPRGCGDVLVEAGLLVLFCFGTMLLCAGLRLGGYVVTAVGALFMGLGASTYVRRRRDRGEPLGCLWISVAFFILVTTLIGAIHTDFPQP